MEAPIIGVTPHHIWSRSGPQPWELGL